MFDQEIFASQIKPDRFPFPSEGDITLAVRNQNYALGPVMLHLVMKPGSVIPAHIHEGVAEVLYVIEGDFINEGSNTSSVRLCTSRLGSRMGHTARKPAARCSFCGRTRMQRGMRISLILNSRMPPSPRDL